MPRFSYRDNEGNVWDSEYEFRVYDALREIGAPVIRCVKGERDTITYTERKQSTHCLDCGSNNCVQTRTYTPDLLIYPAATDALQGIKEGQGLPDGAYFIEAKGYFRANKRKLFRDLTTGRPDIDIRLVAQRNLKVGKGTIMTWAERYAKVPAHVWNTKHDVTDVIPQEWITWKT